MVTIPTTPVLQKAEGQKPPETPGGLKELSPLLRLQNWFSVRSWASLIFSHELLCRAGHSHQPSSLRLDETDMALFWFCPDETHRALLVTGFLLTSAVINSAELI